MNHHLLFITILATCFFMGHTSHAQFKPTPSPNPWPDDYKAVIPMENYQSWGTYNVHDPACKKIGDYYYMYSTDAILMENREQAVKNNVPTGFIQCRRSKDLVDWEFLGWAFPEISAEAVGWVHANANGQGASNIWAPYIIPYKDKFRLYYCVSAFGRKTSYIGMAEAESPTGPWVQKGCVVKTNDATPMNAIDPSVMEDPKTGKWWMHYGSFFGGLYCVELNPLTGLPLTENDYGILTARRANYREENLEAPEIVYQPNLQKYYLFNSYDPLMTTYNVRVCRAEKPDGPFVDFQGKDVRDTTNNFPILTAPYRFNNHNGWAGTGHCGVFDDGNGRYFMVHQGRLSPQNAMMDLHVRQVFFTADGWPVVSPERYAGSLPRTFSREDLAGEWEIIRIQESQHERRLEAGQILWGEGELQNRERNESQSFRFTSKGIITEKGKWKFSKGKQSLTLTFDGEKLKNLIVFAGHDWENETETVLFTGLDSKGRSVWGKRVK